MCPAALNMFWTADPLTNVWRNVVHPSGKMHAGVWDCRAGAFELPCHASTELCVITEGSAEIEDAQGRKTLVKPATPSSSRKEPGPCGASKSM